MTESHDIAIIGAGISGLTTGWRLSKAGFDVIVLEQSSSVGGTIQTVQENGWLIDTGPNSALETTPLFRELFADLGIEDQVVYANEASNNRYILRNGKLHALPMSPGAFLRSRLWSWPGKLKLLKEPFIGRATDEETVASFVTRRLGLEFLDYAINPFVAGVFAGDPRRLSVRAAFPKLYALEKTYGSLIKGQILGAKERKKRAEKAKDRARMFSFKRGMRTLPESLSESLSDKIKTDFQVQRISQLSTRNGNKKRFQVSGTQDGKSIDITSRVVIVAIPSYAAARLIESTDPNLAGSLRKIFYPPVAEVFLGFRQDQVGIKLDGFGFLVPEKEQRKILGTIWSSTIFQDRAPSDCVALTTFVGGSRQPELTGKSEDDLIDLVVRELRELMQVQGNPIYSKIARWEKAIPQYELGHLEIMEDIAEFERKNPGVFFTGNYRGGISVGDCLVSSASIAERVSAIMKIAKEPVTV